MNSLNGACLEDVDFMDL